MERSLTRALTVALVALLLAVPASALAQRSTRGGAEPFGTVQRIRADDGPFNRFRPRSVTVARGTRVRWVNVGDVDHTTTSNTGLWDERLSPGEIYSRRFRQSGTFQYRCTIHPEMTGTIIVT